ncbi:unnamed protein product [Staurois parvus]|uniref:Uncharacterized protein n=1 Tax=Staurois parvus TaxID=386267 RepID=A0ABN9H9T3_9NEOB|nr:unnamed protein product [Staurois parvus]
MHMLCLVYIAREVFFVLGRVHVISTGPIRTVQTEGQGFLILLEQKENSSYKALTSALLKSQDTDRSHKALTADEKRYLALYIY